MANLIKIGNSYGIRIPKPIIEQAHLSGNELTLKVVDDGLLVSSKTKSRDGWQEKIASTLQKHGTEPLDKEWLNAEFVTDDELDW